MRTGQLDSYTFTANDMHEHFVLALEVIDLAAAEDLTKRCKSMASNDILAFVISEMVMLVAFCNKGGRVAFFDPPEGNQRDATHNG